MRAQSAPAANTGPGMRSKGVTESAERSHAVHSANWKEDMLLQKRLQLLNRSQKSLVHRITIDQKVMYRRFQQKLHRSKLAYARMFGDKDKERELRGENLRALNTDCGRGLDDLAFLSKLRPQAQTAPTSRPRDLDSVIAAVMREQASAGERASRSRPSSARRPHTPLPHRPATATGTRVDSEFSVLPEMHGVTATDRITSFVGHLASQTINGSDDVRHDEIRNNYVKPASDVKTTLNQSRRAKTVRQRGRSCGRKAAEDEAGGRRGSTDSADSEGERSMEGSGSSDKVRGRNALRPHTCQAAGSGSGSGSETSSSTDLPPVLGRHHRSAFARLKARRGSTLFEEEKKPNIQRLFLAEVRSQDPGPRVREFCDSLAPLCQVDPLRASADYYSLATLPPPGGRRSPLELPGTPEEEHRRLWGNFHVRSLTVPAINWDFQPDPRDVQDVPPEVHDLKTEIAV